MPRRWRPRVCSPGVAAPPTRARSRGRTAADNGARLETCRVAGSLAEVTVVLRDARAQARAQLDPPTVNALDIEGRAQSGITYATPGSGRIDSSP